ncbi:RNA-binding domain-containing protein [Auriscalpium vulgare]|uniref:RNA-binding domain-containing protein n=1 Tax=Auriscalpium vulgare TaxID=40419 RepID=A0ACB8RYA7_9AGAM|nr:RNA-binding domain-containing protein [Auriscalpium vulgare]
MSLNEFLGDSALGSWADEMDSLPTAPAARGDDDRGDRRGRDDFLSSRQDRQAYPPREDLPLPTQAPYTAFVGNLAFDLTEADLESFFAGSKVKSVKVIKDRDERPKGFGYVEFEDLDDLKGALAMSGSSLSGRTVRVSVAEPPKERGGFGGGFGADDSKFDGEWRRQGPLPDLPERDSSRRRFDGPPAGGDRGERPPANASDSISDWRSSKPRAPPPEAEPPRRKGTGFFASDNAGAADREDSWTKGSKFKPSTDEDGASGRKFGGGFRARGDMGPPPESGHDNEGDWRSAPRPGFASRSSTSPNSSTPPTPQLARRKLELLPRSGNNSGTPSPLASPKMQSSAATSSVRSNPFGAAKPVDVSAKEKVVAERLEKERESAKERFGQHSMSRTSSRTGSDRNASTRTPPASAGATSVPPSPRAQNAPPANVRPTFSFAAAASAKKVGGVDDVSEEPDAPKVEDVTAAVGEVTI